MRVLDAAREHAGLSVDELWLQYFALGGSTSRDEFAAVLDGRRRFTDSEYNVAAHALNERFMDLGLDHPVPYV